MVDVKDKAPDFSLPTGDDDIITLKSLKGQNVVLYFYPKDNTPGCTQEAIDFSSRKKAFEKANTVVIGVSKDSVKKHKNFAEKYDLGHTLVADEEGALCEAYGVWVEKTLYGRKYMGIERATFLIDGKGVVRQVWHNVKVKDHAEAVLTAAKAL